MVAERTDFPWKRLCYGLVRMLTSTKLLCHDLKQGILAKHPNNVHEPKQYWIERPVKIPNCYEGLIRHIVIYFTFPMWNKSHWEFQRLLILPLKTLCFKTSCAFIWFVGATQILFFCKNKMCIPLADVIWF